MVLLLLRLVQLIMRILFFFMSAITESPAGGGKRYNFLLQRPFIPSLQFINSYSISLNPLFKTNGTQNE
jgi:hypothetical protein